MLCFLYFSIWKFKRLIHKGYFYQDGYLRTSSQIFSLANLGSKSIHLTNEAIQKKYNDFGKFEPGNKVL